MTSRSGSDELTRLTAAYVTSIVFGTTFLVAMLQGVDGTTALMRGVTAGAIALVAAHLLAPPVVNVVLDTLAREQARQQAETQEDED